MWIQAVLLATALVTSITAGTSLYYAAYRQRAEIGLLRLGK